MSHLPLIRFAGVFSFNGEARHVTLEAVSLVEARLIAERWAVGITGEAPPLAVSAARTLRKHPREEIDDFLTYTVPEIEAVLKISRPTIYRLIARKIFRPVPGIRHKLIPRDQVVKFVAGSGKHGRN
ncbi:helix-turn-helix domain-containing protein [Oleiharenicola lentus]|uniref:helix-turn-helix domain-containing protein n=1 Tax=Oleiharenicola lentus TaxID=2508720 RepID=UPI003F67810B